MSDDTWRFMGREKGLGALDFEMKIGRCVFGNVKGSLFLARKDLRMTNMPPGRDADISV